MRVSSLTILILLTLAVALQSVKHAIRHESIVLLGNRGLALGTKPPPSTKAPTTTKAPITTKAPTTTKAPRALGTKPPTTTKKATKGPRMFMRADSTPSLVLQNKADGFRLMPLAQCSGGACFPAAVAGTGRDCTSCNRFKLMPQASCAASGGGNVCYSLMPPKSVDVTGGYAPPVIVTTKSSIPVTTSSSPGATPASTTYHGPPARTPSATTYDQPLPKPATTAQHASYDNSNDNSNSSGTSAAHLSSAAIGGIAAACVVVLVAAAALVYMKTKAKKREDDMFAIDKHHDVENPSHTNYAAM
ncbi:Aste57867_17921 [Aphanomyces stellatus]|uniref:Aste57867_17921 protein n=1 Tax=Aphanomyces stellatus TaxID=120398 RepID=A0A485L8R3_9STRA|nr:hypothetical protein As57867_017860 [Aphanomyces stellatus]VFT94663.1 Aste57867_17921 [Aphanomyces stellatus]